MGVKETVGSACLQGHIIEPNLNMIREMGSDNETNTQERSDTKIRTHLWKPSS